MFWGLAAVFGGSFFISAQGEMAQERQRHSRMTVDGDNGKGKTANDSNEALDYNLPGRRQGTTTARPWTTAFQGDGSIDGPQEHSRMTTGTVMTNGTKGRC